MTEHKSMNNQNKQIHRHWENKIRYRLLSLSEFRVLPYRCSLSYFGYGLWILSLWYWWSFGMITCWIFWSTANFSFLSNPWNNQVLFYKGIQSERAHRIYWLSGSTRNETVLYVSYQANCNSNTPYVCSNSLLLNFWKVFFYLPL